MFGRARREARKAAFETQKNELVAVFEERLRLARATEETGARFLALKSVEDDIKSHKVSFDENCQKIKAKVQGNGTIIGSASLAAPLIIAGIVTANPFLFFIGAGSMSAGAFGGTLAGFMYGDKKIKGMVAKNADLFDRLAVIADDARKAADDIVDREIVSIAQSPVMQEIFDAHPFVRDAFAKAALKNMQAPPAPKQRRDQGLRQ